MIMGAESDRYPWTLETMRMINELTRSIEGKAFDPDWFLLRQHFEQTEDKFRDQGLIWENGKGWFDGNSL